LSLPTAEASLQARRDIRHHVLWLREEADALTASRFADQAISSFQKLTEAPGMGSPVPTANPALFGIRKWRIEGFPRYLILYRANDSGVEVIRVLHAAQDWWAMFDVN
jgi:toxin ParE1/3/4